MPIPSNVLGAVALKLPLLPLAKLAALDVSKLKFTKGSRSAPGGDLKQKPVALPLENDVTALQTSFSIRESLRRIRRRKWSVLDIQYVSLACLTIFSLWIIEPAAPFIKTAAFLGYMLLLLMPATNQFFLPSWPIWTYLLFFFSSRFVPYDVRPLVSVKVLPALEDILYGADLSNIISEYTNPVLDLLAWFPYGIGHFGLPAVCSALMFLFAAPGTTPYFARSFGWMSILGVAVQLVFPCTPPWYEKLHGLEPAQYGMQGSPAGLARIDALFGVDLYTTSFTTAPVPFGAFPSLHAADAALEALFMSYCFPKLRGFCIFYVAWLCWATMYLNHHYAVDLIGGIVIAVSIFLVVRARWLPQQQPDKAHRWEYSSVDVGLVKKMPDEESGLRRNSDTWSDHSGCSSSTLIASPVTPEVENQWNRETIVRNEAHNLGRHQSRPGI
ncbi:hypothetical protein DL768_006401 [Monosporascus sp. mg162]|nr:hypothetical protein DL768_006401 [Monosporascus sp. mg162]